MTRVFLKSPFRMQRRIQNPVKHLRWSFFSNLVKCWKPFTIFTKIALRGFWMRLSNASSLEKNNGKINQTVTKIKHILGMFPCLKYIYKSACIPQQPLCICCERYVLWQNRFILPNKRFLFQVPNVWAYWIYNYYLP